MRKLKTINIAALHTLEHHISNANEDASTKRLNKNGEEFSYISGQKIRYSFLENTKNLNKMESENTMVTNSDGVTPFVEWDLRADFGGYMITDNKKYSNRRTSPLSVAMAVSLKEYNSFNDLWVRFSQNNDVQEADRKDKKKQHSDQRINNKEYSVKDIFNVAYSLDLERLSSERVFKYVDGFNVEEQTIQHVSNEEKLRRIKLYINATSNLAGLANQSRAMVNNKPNSLLITFDYTNDQSHVNFFKLSTEDREVYLANLAKRGIKFIYARSPLDVDSAYTRALELLNELADEVPYSNVVKSVKDLYIEQAKSKEDIKFILDVYGNRLSDEEKTELEQMMAKLKSAAKKEEKTSDDSNN